MAATLHVRAVLLLYKKEHRNMIAVHAGLQSTVQQARGQVIQTKHWGPAKRKQGI
jgi:copper oxidase (laccase) domain-containing protein